MAENKLKKMEELVEKLNAASDAYYNGLPEIMTDYEWDAMFDELRALEIETDTILENSPTHNVSKDDVVGNKEEHEFLALSLAKTKKVDDLVKWAEGKPIWFSWKLDGLTLVVTYDKGKLHKVVTRGDGHIGTNITHLASGIDGILPTIKHKGHVVIRGEAVISYEDFEIFKLETGEDYANPRNLASGSLSLKDVEELKQRKIHWIPFTLTYIDEDIPSWEDRMNLLEKEGFQVVQRRCVKKPDKAFIQKEVDKWTEEVTSGKNPYPVDGLVITYDDTVYAQSGSVTGHHATKAGYAFKWQDESRHTSLKQIEWSCAASTITPVAIFEPVELEGTIVKRASLCNISECERLHIGDVGTEIEVIKANKIIPKVIHVDKTVGKLKIPKECPVCGSTTEISISENSGTKTLKCTNPKCAAKQLKKYSRFVSKAGMDIDGISEATLATFISEGWIKNYGDIFRLDKHSKDIAELDGFGEKSANNISNSLQKAKTVNEEKLIYALNIPHVAQDVAKRLLEEYSFTELMDKAIKADDETIFSSISGIGPEKSSAFVNWFKDKENVEYLNDLLKEIEVVRQSNTQAGNRCEGLTFVVTGDVHHYKNRNELKAYIESQGGKVTSAVSKSTNYLINNDIASTSGKNQKAKELDIPIISEDEFMDLFV